MNQKNFTTRLLSLDVFRGITIALMILVNSPGNRSVYSMFEHSAWNGCTLADVVFPFFIVIVGMSSVFALYALRIKGVSNDQLLKVIIKRTVYLFVMGLLLNALLKNFDFINLRILGVLQRIALCYFFSSLLFLTRIRVQIIVISLLLVGYWFLIGYFPTPAPLSASNNLVSYLDRLIFSPRHLYNPLYDPEGLLSTIPAIVSALFGNLLAYCLISPETKEKQLHRMVLGGFILSALGLIWSLVFPFNKFLWSSSYVLWTSGLAYLAFAVCFALIEIKKRIFWSNSFALFGKNAMLVYILHIVFLKIQALILLHNSQGELINLRFYITDLLFGYLTPHNASLCYAITYTLLWLFLLKKWGPLRLKAKDKTNINLISEKEF